MNPWILLGLVAGALIPLQSGINASLRPPLGSAMLAALVSFTAGSITLILCCLAWRVSLPSMQAIESVRPWAWFAGGMCGAFFVTANVILTPRLGIGTTLVLTIAAQLLVSLAFDHIGAFGTSVHPVNWQRAVGASLVVGGAFLMKRF